MRIIWARKTKPDYLLCVVFSVKVKWRLKKKQFDSKELRTQNFKKTLILLWWKYVNASTIHHDRCLLVFKSCSVVHILIPNQLLTWLTFVCTCMMSSSQLPQSAASLVSGLSLVDRILLCLLARHQVAEIAVTLPSFLSLSISLFSFSLSVCLQSHQVNLQDWESFPGFLCTQTLAGERRHLQDGLEFIEMDLLCCLLQLTSLAYTSKSFFLLYSFFLSFSPSLPSIRSPGWSCVYSWAGSWQHGDKCWGWEDEKQWRERGRKGD